ncbi:hypothetical protein [Enterobacter cloacae]|uniref:hypothetical protein n=1 Tax=Enterobacter cloacae TaxID=550 RepID=UPI003DA15770
MSQLSFASFFDQAREAAPLTPAKPVLPTVNAQPIPHRMMTIDQARRQFISVFSAYSALFDHGLASKFDQRFASIRSTGNLTFPTAF